MRFTSSRRLVAALSLLGLLASCGGSDGDGDEPSSASGSTIAEEPTAGGDLVWLVNSAPIGLDPASALAVTPGSEGKYMVAIYDTLVRVDAEGEVTGRLLKSVTTDDSVTWTLEVRPDVTFTDGTPFDAEAVAFNWKRHLDPAAASGCKNLATSEFAEIEVVGPTTLEVQLNRPESQFPRNLANTCLAFIGSPTAIEADPTGFATEPVGAGPFVVAENAADHLLLEKNHDFWDAPRPYLDSIRMNYIADNPSRANAFRTGAGDLVLFPTPSVDQAQIVADDVVAASAESWGGTVWQLNLESAPFDDVRVRQAFVRALDLDEFNDATTGNAGTPVVQVFPESSPFFVDISQETGQLEEAQELIDAYIEEQGGPVTFSLFVQSPLASTAEATAQMLNRLEGVEAKVEPLDRDTIRQRISAGSWQVSFTGVSGFDPEPRLYDSLHSEGALNSGGYSNPEVDEALEAGRSSSDLGERKEAYEVVQRHLVEDVPLVFLLRLEFTNVASDRLQGLSLFDFGFVDVARLWLRQ